MKETMKGEIEHLLVNWTYLHDVTDAKVGKVRKGEEFSVFVSYAAMGRRKSWSTRRFPLLPLAMTVAGFSQNQQGSNIEVA